MKNNFVALSFAVAIIALAIIAFAPQPALSDTCSEAALAAAKSKPPQVQFLTATAIGYDGAKLTWTLFANVCAPVKKVTVQRQGSSGPSQSMNGEMKTVYNYPPEQTFEATNSGGAHPAPLEAGPPEGSTPPMLGFSDHGLTPATSYTYYVCATNLFAIQGCAHVAFRIGAPPPAPMPDPEKPHGVFAVRKDKSTASVIWKTSTYPANATDSFQVQFINAASLAAVVAMPNPPFQVRRSSIDRNLRSIDFYAPLPPKPLVLIVRVCAVNIVHIMCSDVVQVTAPTMQLAPPPTSGPQSVMPAPQYSP